MRKLTIILILCLVINMGYTQNVLQPPQDTLPHGDTTYLDFDYTKPLEVDNKEILYRSILLPYKEGITNMGGTNSHAYVKETKVKRFFALNHSPFSMFYAAYSRCNGPIYINRIESHVRDNQKLGLTSGSLLPRDETQYIYCYELMLPQPLPRAHFHELLLDELNKLFEYTASIEKREKECWILKSTKGITHNALDSTTPKLIWKDGYIRGFRNQDIDVLATYLNWEFDTMHVVNETFYSGKVNVDLDFVNHETGKKDLEQVRKSLNRYGLDLIKGRRLVDILVIRDK